MRTGNYVDAERFAEVTYSNLQDKKNGINQGCEEVAMGEFNLADIIWRQDGDCKGIYQHQDTIMWPSIFECWHKLSTFRQILESKQKTSMNCL
jgi:hypothetical protein